MLKTPIPKRRRLARIKSLAAKSPNTPTQELSDIALLFGLFAGNGGHLARWEPRGSQGLHFDERVIRPIGTPLPRRWQGFFRVGRHPGTIAKGDRPDYVLGLPTTQQLNPATFPLPGPTAGNYQKKASRSTMLVISWTRMRAACKR